MAGKSRRPPRSGVGGFPTNALSPVLVSLYHPPLHSSDEWEAEWRPFWCVKYPAARTCAVTCSLGDMYSRTLTPTFCPVALVATLPMYSIGVYVGACGRWEPAEWTERKDYRSAARGVRPYLKYNPVSQVAWDARLNADTVQTYAVAGDIRTAGPLPLTDRKVPYKPPGWPTRYSADDGKAEWTGYNTDLGGEA